MVLKIGFCGSSLTSKIIVSVPRRNASTLIPFFYFFVLIRRFLCYPCYLCDLLFTPHLFRIYFQSQSYRIYFQSQNILLDFVIDLLDFLRIAQSYRVAYGEKSYKY